MLNPWFAAAQGLVRVWLTCAALIACALIGGVRRLLQAQVRSSTRKSRTYSSKESSGVVRLSAFSAATAGIRIHRDWCRLLFRQPKVLCNSKFDLTGSRRKLQQAVHKKRKVLKDHVQQG